MMPTTAEPYTRENALDQVGLDQVGRPLKLTPELVDEMVYLIMMCGNSPASAAVLLDVSEPTFYRWMKKGREQTHGRFREFRDVIEAAKRWVKSNA